MTTAEERALLDAIIADDVSSFDDRIGTGQYRFGRFPVLSLLYMYDSKKILKSYEDALIRISEYEAISEPLELATKFSAVAGKCLRIYRTSVITPVEMLMLLGRFARCNKVYAAKKPETEALERLKMAYYIRFHKSVTFSDKRIAFERRDLTLRQRWKIIWVSCAAGVVVIALAVGLGVGLYSREAPDMSREILDGIDFASTESFVLNGDITLPEDLSIDEFKCTLDGGGHTITVTGGGTHFKTLYGKISNVNFKTDCSALFDLIYLGAEVSDCTLDAKVDRTINSGIAGIANYNYGTIKNVGAKMSGSITAEYVSGITEEEGLLVGGLVYSNAKTFVGFQQRYGIIENCSVDLSLSLKGDLGTNSAFGGVSGYNAGLITGCTVKGSITSDTFDVAGICSENDLYIISSQNEASIYTLSNNGMWNPLSAGIAIKNNYMIQRCVNSGSIRSVSTGVSDDPERDIVASAAGIAVYNYNAIEYVRNVGNVAAISTGTSSVEGYNSTVEAAGICTNAYGYVVLSRNDGTVDASGVYSALAGGIAAEGYSQLLNCVSAGNITVKGRTAYAGGILGFSICTAINAQAYSGQVDGCIADCVVTIDRSASKAYIGGIAGYVQERVFTYIGSDQKTTLGGGVNGCYFTGELRAPLVAYTGSVVGASGKYIYENNEIQAGKYHYNGNMYVAGSSVAVGATIEFDTDNKELSGAGGDQGAETHSADEIRTGDKYMAIIAAAGVTDA